MWICRLMILFRMLAPFWSCLVGDSLYPLSSELFLLIWAWLYPSPSYPWFWLTISHDLICSASQYITFLFSTDDASGIVLLNVCKKPYYIVPAPNSRISIDNESVWKLKIDVKGELGLILLMHEEKVISY